jgi:hypothetical protein
MYEKEQQETSDKKMTTGCGCGQQEGGHGCPCKKRFCLPILGLVGLAVVVSVAASRRKEK